MNPLPHILQSQEGQRASLKYSGISLAAVSCASHLKQPEAGHFHHWRFSALLHLHHYRLQPGTCKPIATAKLHFWLLMAQWPFDLWCFMLTNLALSLFMCVCGGGGLIKKNQLNLTYLEFQVSSEALWAFQHFNILLCVQYSWKALSADTSIWF